MSGSCWRSDDIAQLEQLRHKGAAQLEIATALPVRTWETIRKKFAERALLRHRMS